MTTAELLTSYETCDRKGYWAKRWERRRLSPNQILLQAIRAGVTEASREDFGVLAGETVMELAAEPGMETPTSRFLHESVVHHAALADILTSALRKPQSAPWGVPGYSESLWTPSALLDPAGERLRGITLASSWNDERHYSTVRSWYGLGEVAMAGIPMTMVVLILGQHRDGRRSGPWTRGFLHPQNHKLRFRKKAKVSSEIFSDRWEQVWREDRGEIENAQWLQAMLDDDILRDVCFTIDIPVPEELELVRIRDMAARKRDRLAKVPRTPEASMSVCDRPPCPFRGCCWSERPYDPNEKSGFVNIV